MHDGKFGGVGRGKWSWLGARFLGWASLGIIVLERGGSGRGDHPARFFVAGASSEKEGGLGCVPGDVWVEGEGDHRGRPYREEWFG